MSEFNVVTTSVGGAGARLTGISTEIAGALGRVAACSGAAAGTPLHGGFEDLLGHWGAVLPRFGEAGDRLSGALSGAAAYYASTEAGVRTEAGGS